MAIGDRIPTEFISKNLTTTAGDSIFTNTSSSYRTQITNIMLNAQSGGSTVRQVTLYKNGTAVANQKGVWDIDPTGATYPKNIIIEMPIILNNTDTFQAKVDAGTDINIEVSGVVEQIA